MSLRIDTPVQFIKGVGPHLGGVLARRDIKTVKDLYEWYPRAYEDRRLARNISSLAAGDLVSLKAQVLSVSSGSLGRSSRKIFDVFVRDDSGRIHCKFFRAPYKGYFERFQTGQWVRVIGKVTQYRGVLEFHHPDLFDLASEEEELKNSVIPIYTETEGLSSRRLMKILGTALTYAQDVVTEVLPKWMLEKYNLEPRSQALKGVHQPPDSAGPEFLKMQSPFHRRIIFEEFFWLELALGLRRGDIKRETSFAMTDQPGFQDIFQKNLPFQLTGAQKRAFEEIRNDLLIPHPMHRLVQGDVGSGKTAVAMMAASFVAKSGFQSALMVPTEILAEQHLKNAVKYLEPLGVRVRLLSGTTGAKERREIQEALKNGEIDLLVGTHALIEDDVDFKSLGLVIIDEQHRFGVHQRNALKRKGVSPHFLIMTATPIPRTLAMTVYGDLDVSIINELPPGRAPILTKVVYESKSESVYGFMRDQVLKGRQAYIVFPLVEESEKIDLKNAVEEFEKLSKEYPEVKFGLLHGKMKPAEKDDVMNRFRAGELQALVSTTVIEVGVDVPNANMMIIEHSERFGLSQLHQLRGRVGRGVHKSYCVLMLGYAVSEEAKSRCDVMAETGDGFKIAEADLEMRGPGEFLGARQSGLTGFKLANLVRDMETLMESRKAVEELLQRDPLLQKPEHAPLREEVLRSGGVTSLATVG